MPRRREPRSSARGGSSSASATDPQPARRRLLPRLRLDRPTLASLGIGAVGAMAGLLLLGLVWPERDRALAPHQDATAATLAEKPRRAVTVLVIGTDADRLDAASNGAAPAGPANADALLLVRVNPKGPLQVLNLPVELAVNLPGLKAPQRLGDVFRRGGVALTADAVREVVGLDPPAPDRYVVLPRGALRQVVNDLGGLELSPPRTLRYQDRSQKLRIDLQAGLQRLGGAQVEQLVRYRDKWLGEGGRRADQALVVASLRDRMAQPEQLVRLPDLLGRLEGKVETNLDPREVLSLLAAGLDSSRPVQFTSLPLSPAKPGHGALRQLERTAPRQLWPLPKG